MTTTEPVYLRPPPQLLTPCPVPGLEGDTNADLVEWALALRGSLKTCNQQLQALRLYHR